MKVRKNFVALESNESNTPVYDAVSMTQPEMSMSIKQIVDRFAFVGDTPLGMMQFPEPSLKSDEALFDSVDVERLDIAELEQLSQQLAERAEWLRSQTPPTAPAAAAAAMPDGEADAPPAK